MNTTTSTMGWTEYMKSIEPQMNKLGKMVDRLVRMSKEGKRNTVRYTTLRNKAISICNSIGDDFEDYAGYFGI